MSLEFRKLLLAKWTNGAFDLPINSYGGVAVYRTINTDLEISGLILSACHAGLTYNKVKQSAACITYHAPPRDFLRKAAVNFADWLINSSPMQAAFLDKDPEKAIEKGYLTTLDVPGDLLLAAVQFSRLSTSEYKNLYAASLFLATLMPELHPAVAFAYARAAKLSFSANGELVTPSYSYLLDPVPTEHHLEGTQLCETFLASFLKAGPPIEAFDLKPEANFFSRRVLDHGFLIKGLQYKGSITEELNKVSKLLFKGEKTVLKPTTEKESTSYSSVFGKTVEDFVKKLRKRGWLEAELLIADAKELQHNLTPLIELQNEVLKK